MQEEVIIMPARNGTGPERKGAGTGRRRGWCFNKKDVVKGGLLGSIGASIIGLVTYDLKSSNSILKSFTKKLLDNKARKESAGKIEEKNNEIIDAEYEILEEGKNKKSD